MFVDIFQMLYCTASDATFSCDPWWNPAAEEQERSPELGDCLIAAH
jgi:hypothetical protein